MSKPSRKSSSEPRTEAPTSYEDLFAEFSAGAEKLMIRLAATLALLLLAAQLALLIPAVREVVVRVERLEGVPFGSYSDIDSR